MAPAPRLEKLSKAAWLLNAPKRAKAKKLEAEADAARNAGNIPDAVRLGTASVEAHIDSAGLHWTTLDRMAELCESLRAAGDWDNLRRYADIVAENAPLTDPPAWPAYAGSALARMELMQVQKRSGLPLVAKRTLDALSRRLQPGTHVMRRIRNIAADALLQDRRPAEALALLDTTVDGYWQGESPSLQALLEVQERRVAVLLALGRTREAVLQEQEIYNSLRDAGRQNALSIEQWAAMAETRESERDLPSAEMSLWVAAALAMQTGAEGDPAALGPLVRRLADIRIRRGRDPSFAQNMLQAVRVVPDADAPAAVAPPAPPRQTTLLPREMARGLSEVGQTLLPRLRAGDLRHAGRRAAEALHRREGLRVIQDAAASSVELDFSADLSAQIDRLVADDDDSASTPRWMLVLIAMAAVGGETAQARRSLQQLLAQLEVEKSQWRWTFKAPDGMGQDEADYQRAIAPWNVYLDAQALRLGLDWADSDPLAWMQALEALDKTEREVAPDPFIVACAIHAMAPKLVTASDLFEPAPRQQRCIATVMVGAMGDPERAAPVAALLLFLAANRADETGFPPPAPREEMRAQGRTAPFDALWLRPVAACFTSRQWLRLRLVAPIHARCPALSLHLLDRAVPGLAQQLDSVALSGVASLMVEFGISEVPLFPRFQPLWLDIVPLVAGHSGPEPRSPVWEPLGKLLTDSSYALLANVDNAADNVRQLGRLLEPIRVQLERLTPADIAADPPIKELADHVVPLLKLNDAAAH